MKFFKHKNILALLLVVLFTIPSFMKIVRPGFFPMQDDMQVFRLEQLDKCFQDFQIPCRWIPDGGYQYGYPQFNFYAPFVYYIAEIFHALGFQFIDAIKIIIVLGFILGGITMYVLASELFGFLPALVASILYTYAPYKAQEIYVRGALSEFWASVFFPLILWSIYKLIQTNKTNSWHSARKYVLWTAISIAGLFITHNILSFLFIPIMLLWILYWVSVEKQFRVWRRIILSFVLAALLSAFFVFPMLFERSFAHTETLLGGYFDYHQHFVTIKELFFSNIWGYGSSMLGPVDDLSLSVGIPHWVGGVLAVLAALLSFKKDKKLSILIFSFAVIEFVILFLMHERSSVIWNAIHPLAWLQFPWRFLSLSVFLLSFLAAYLVSHLTKTRFIAGFVIILSTFVLYGSFFSPLTWLNISDTEKLTGPLWEKELTASIFDYLPIYAKFPPDNKAPDFPEILTGKADILNYSKGSNFQKGNITVYEDSTFRAPLFDFPGMTVYLNGQVVPHTHDNCIKERFCLGLVSFNVLKGEYDFKVKLENTPIRTLANTLTLSGIFITVFLFLNKNAKILKK